MAFWLCLVTAGLVSGATVGTWSVTCDPVVCSSTDAAVCAQEQAQFQANCDQKIAAAKGKAEADTAAANLAAQITAADAAAIAAGSPAVVCGGHLASVCEKCGNTAGSCNGDCVWKGTICRRGAIKATTTTTRAPGGTLTQPTSTGNATPTTSGGANTGSGNTGGGSTGDGANTGSDKKTGSDTNAGSGSNEGSSTGGDNGSAASSSNETDDDEDDGENRRWKNRMLSGSGIANAASEKMGIFSNCGKPDSRLGSERKEKVRSRLGANETKVMTTREWERSNNKSDAGSTRVSVARMMDRELGERGGEQRRCEFRASEQVAWPTGA
eukprot:GEMP01018974.1.p1 GENE.GEMP01018974.1~~GEMP01018974.1.p1  ORF type:complete len:326 (+),score=78.08 GEMP01018974.1:129-1106(+)